MQTKKREPPSTKCDVCLQMFQPATGYRPCDNCGRNFCPAHRETSLGHEITNDDTRWCVCCGNAYRAGGLEGMKKERMVPLRGHGS